MTRLQDALSHLEQATRLLTLEIEDRHGAADDFALCDAHGLSLDAVSQLRSAVADEMERRTAA